MRKVLTAIVVLIVLVWLIPYDPQPDGQTQVPPPVAPVVATPASGSTPATDNAPVLSDEPAADDPAEPPVLLPDQVALTPMEQKAQSARALIDPGLASIEKAFACRGRRSTLGYWSGEEHSGSDSPSQLAACDHASRMQNQHVPGSAHGASIQESGHECLSRPGAWLRSRRVADAELG